MTPDVPDITADEEREAERRKDEYDGWSQRDLDRMADFAAAKEVWG